MGQGYRGWPRPKTVLPPSYREATEETLYESGAFVVFGNQLCSRHVFTAKGRRDSGELNSLDYRRRRHAVTDAHRLQAIAGPAALQFVDQLGHQDGTRRADRVSVGMVGFPGEVSRGLESHL